MKIAGLVKSSLIDYPGKVAAVVFTQGCNFRCGFCHNPDLIAIDNQQSIISEQETLDFLETRVGKLDGVVITGGEPLIQPDIEEFIARIKYLGFSVKLDTNGSSPDKLARLIDARQVDYIAMDIKGPLLKYDKICAYLNTKVIQRSVEIIMNSGLDYEFRTTVLPAFHALGDFTEIGKLIKGAKSYTIQGYRPENVLDPVVSGTAKFTGEELEQIRQTVAPFAGEVTIHENI